MEEDIKWKAFFAARRIKFNRRGKKNEMYIESLGSWVIYCMICCFV